MDFLSKYKNFLDKNTMDAMENPDLDNSRFKSFEICLNKLKSFKNPSILELGTCRSFVDGSFAGCNSNDTKYWDPLNSEKWDWGAGCFSLIFGQYGYNLTTVDLISDHIARCKVMTDSLNINCNHIVSNSLDFLNLTKEKYDLIYLDTGDMFPIEPSQDLQLEEVKIIVRRNLLKNDGIILIDDVLNSTPRKLGITENKYGKSDKSIPFLLENSFNPIYSGYQWIFSK